MHEQCLMDLEKFFVDGRWWAGSYGNQFANKPKPEFNKIWKSVQRVVGDINDLELNAVIASNSSDATDDDAELLQKRWRHDFHASYGAEASEQATMEAVVGGIGCVKMTTRHEDEENPDDDEQYVCFEPVYSACSTVFFDVGALSKDKHDARFGWHVVNVNRRAIEEEYGLDVVSFAAEPFINDLPVMGGKDAYVAHYWEVVEKTITTYDFTEMMDGNYYSITTGDGIKDNQGNKVTRDGLKLMMEDYATYMEMDGIMDAKPPTSKRKVKMVEYALMDGEKFLVKSKTPFKRVPLFPRYGYWAMINGFEYFCGEVRKKTDTEMFNNMIGSSMMQIASKDQVPKPEYAPEQIQRFASQRASADNDNVPFLMSDPIKDKNGNILLAGPISVHQPPAIGTGLQAANQYLELNTQQHNGSGQTTTPSNTSAMAIQQVNDRNDDCYLPMVKNVCYAIRAQCDAWIPTAQYIYFSNQRRLRVEEHDGNYSMINTLEMGESEDGVYGPFVNSGRGRYTVVVRTGQSYKDEQAQEFEQSLQIAQMVGSQTEVGQMAALTAVINTSGEGSYYARTIARYRQIDMMMQMGIPNLEPQNEDEEQYIQNKIAQMQQAQQQQDPMQQMAQAEMIKAQADQAKIQVDMYNAESKRIDTNTNAMKAGVEAQLKQQDQVLRMWEKRYMATRNGR
ncbi:MAG: hypothetical protein GY914_05085 [Prochlorococcus sp.]|nr:hypothetical protein [Prochlorococcus sp.]